MSALRYSLMLVAALALTGLVTNAQRGGRGGQPAPPAPELNLPPNPRLDALKQELVADIDARRQFTQQMVDSIFSYSELGFQEVETQRYITDILVREGFEIERGIAGMPTSWIGKYGSGRPIVALGTDIDGLPTTNQTPGVVTRKELVAGAPGHGEGHNAGQAIVVTAALALKKIMEREKLPGTIVLWPGVAEEALGAKAHFVRSGVFKDVDAVLFLHVGSNLEHGLGRRRRQRYGVGRVHVHRFELACRRRAMGRQERARRRRADEHRLELPARASPHPAALPLRHHQRRRSAERRAAERIGLVLLPRDRLRPHQGDVGAWRHDGQGGGDDDRHDRRVARPRVGVAPAWQPADCAGDARQHPAGRHAAVERCGPAVRARVPARPRALPSAGCRRP